MKFVTFDRKTPMLLPEDLRDWVREDDLVPFVIEVVERGAQILRGDEARARSDGFYYKRFFR